jgi:hypothetical protein
MKKHQFYKTKNSLLYVGFNLNEFLEKYECCSNCLVRVMCLVEGDNNEVEVRTPCSQISILTKIIG